MNTTPSAELSFAVCEWGGGRRRGGRKRKEDGVHICI